MLTLGSMSFRKKTVKAHVLTVVILHQMQKASNAFEAFGFALMEL